MTHSIPIYKFKEWGRKGGNQTKRSRPKDYYKKIGAKGGRPRKSLKQATKSEKLSTEKA